MSAPLPWQVVLPVKHAGTAKTRLVPPAGVSRRELARAMARDTLVTVCRAQAADQVVVVTSDTVAVDLATGLGARVLPDPGQGLDAAVRVGLAACRPHLPVAVLLGDLPALLPADLVTALAACARHTRAVVPDHSGAGTVLLTGTDGDVEPAFGVGSAARHARAATRLDLDLPRLRQDVDDAADLQRAVALG
ncbi:MAG: 2-phospho-L-lactate guanylyltransferase, partial [Actinobacteria bacterium]|nr:2-phospho-L-lactate guanylyltransferase [Actinomycetota bacterium]